MAQVASKTCEICVASPGHNYCEQCDQLFCDGCKISHLRTKMTKNHTFTKGININPGVKQYCNEHDESFIYYCLQCDVPVCKICAIEEHKNHDLSEIKESALIYSNHVGVEIQSKLDILQRNIEDIHQGTKKYQADVNNVIRAIRKEGSQLKKLIDSKVEELIKSLKEKEEINLQTLQSISIEFKTAFDVVKKHEESYREAQGIKDTARLLQKLQQIESEISDVETQPDSVLPSVKFSSGDVTQNEIDKLFGKLRTRDSKLETSKTHNTHRYRQHKEKKSMYRYMCECCGSEQVITTKPTQQESLVMDCSSITCGGRLHEYMGEE
ncbi:E3 ubiquitin-protein ligase TRIM45-like [Mytilus galloprovincialis]|uniref:E3 ubiquitin-protein ligase TRIM45-like n=1 Tax=Mytilus galloprovincialis TaxID=29158 RepID=UPI003F7CB909